METPCARAGSVVEPQDAEVVGAGEGIQGARPESCQKDAKRLRGHPPRGVAITLGQQHAADVADIRCHIRMLVVERRAVDPLGRAVALQRPVQIALLLEHAANVVDVPCHLGMFIAERRAVDSLGLAKALQRPVQITFGIEHAADIVDANCDFRMVVAERRAVDPLGLAKAL